MAIYHVNPNTGNPNICRAEKGGCPFGGTNEHYDTKAEAREAYEKQMDEATLALKSVQKEISDRRESNGNPDLDNADRQADLKSAVEDFPKFEVSKAEQKMLDDLAAGKKVSDSKLDLFLVSHRNLTVDDGFKQQEHIESARRVFAHIEQIRRDRGTPSTLATLDKFDPATQTLFSNPEARTNPYVAGKAIRREMSNSDWLNELADRNEQNAATLKDSSVTPEQYLNAAKEQRRRAHESLVRVKAQIREVQYLFDTDPKFASRADRDLHSLLSAGHLRTLGDNDKDVWIGPVKKAK